MKRLLSALPIRAYLQLKWTYGKLFDRTMHRELQQLRHTITRGSLSLQEFDRRRAIFVHIPKCAGIAVKKALFDDLSGGHIKLSTYCRTFEPDLFLAYFKFTFVRNPWDRLVSAYHFLKGGGYGERDRQWFERELSAYGDFDDFVCKWLRPENMGKHVHFWPQSDFLVDRNHSGVKVDYVAFYENIDEDFRFIARRIGVEKELRKQNTSSHKSYMDYYRDETREIVRNLYLADIERFGYDFENTNLPAQIANRDAIVAGDRMASK